MNALTILVIGVVVVALAGVVVGAFGHAVVVNRKTSMLTDWGAELEVREMHLTLAPPATRAPRAVGTSTVVPRDPHPNAPTRAREDEPADQQTRRHRAYRFAADAYPTIAHAARTLSDPLPAMLIPGRPQDTRPLADALTGNPRAHVGRHAAQSDDWT